MPNRIETSVHLFHMSAHLCSCRAHEERCSAFHVRQLCSSALQQRMFRAPRAHHLPCSCAGCTRSPTLAGGMWCLLCCLLGACRRGGSKWGLRSWSLRRGCPLWDGRADNNRLGGRETKKGEECRRHLGGLEGEKQGGVEQKRENVDREERLLRLVEEGG